MAILVRRRLLRRFFWFSLYIVYVLIEAAVRFAVAGNEDLYFKVYWVTSAAGLVFLVMAVREGFLNVFWVHARLKWFAGITWGCVGLALLYAMLKAWFFPPVHGGWQTAAIIGSEVAVEYCVTAVAAVYFVFRWIFKIRGQEWETGIMWGFAIYESLALVGSITRSILGSKYRIVSEWLPPVAYIIGELTWVLELRRDEPEVTAPAEELAVDYLRNMEDYIRVLGRMFRRKA
ncbi:MAG TPA: hypothetical protein VI636_24310 [Candidatus Angelobacter sp.]